MESKRSPSSLEFGRFKVLPHRRQLTADGKPVELRGRLFDLLMVLISARGRVVSKDDLLDLVWAGRVVEENNLAVAISALRRALGPQGDVIRTVSGRGYQFVGDVREEIAASLSGRLTNLPPPISELIGRESALSEVCRLVREHRLSTLTGAGGIGKTRLAMEAARSLLENFPDGVWIVDLAPLTDSELVPSTVAVALGLGSSDLSPEQIGDLVGTRHMLVLLDNCEHVIDVAARMAHRLVRGPNVFVMCTSREPLRVEGEWVFQVQPLDVPEEGTPSEDAVLNSGAAKLFITRARAAQPLLRLDPSVIARMAFICRRLDGMPLAIELAAARAAVLGVQGVAARLNERFRLLTGGSRMALPRHQTLRATLDWSYELLGESERLILRRLGIFAGEFTLDAAADILSGTDDASDEVTTQVASLVEKSLVTVYITGEVARYRMLDTTRAYALEKLGECGELQQYARRHAQYHLAVFKRAWREWSVQPLNSWSPEYCRLLDDARAALDWAFSSSGDAMVGAELTVCLAAVWIRLSLLSEWINRAKQSQHAIASSSQSTPRLEMELNAALGIGLLYSVGAVPEARDSVARTLEIAERLGDTEYQLIALWGHYCSTSYVSNADRPHLLLACAERFARVAKIHGDAGAEYLGDCLKAHALIELGDVRATANTVDIALSRGIRKTRGLPLSPFESSISPYHAFTLWLRGFPDHCRKIIEQEISAYIALGHAVSYSIHFGQSLCPFLLIMGDLTRAEQCLELLEAQQKKAPLTIPDVWISDLRGALQVQRGELDRGWPALRATCQRQTVHIVAAHELLMTLYAQTLGHTGQVEEGLSVIAQALRESETTNIRWFVTEFLRVRGDLLLMSNSPAVLAEAEQCYLQSLQTARQQGALAWELRTAMSLARLQERQCRSEHAVQQLQSVYDRFTEGFDTPDLVAARALLEHLRALAAAAV